jgi:5-oxoprolinase (ATP-hydrolysing)
MNNNENYKFRFNIDRGGTFTDIYCEYFINSESSTCTDKIVHKLLSQDQKNYEDAPSEGIRRILQQITKQEINKGTKIPSHFIESIRMGTTIATNALLERKGEKCALLISEGFRDLIEIGNQTRPNIFDLKIEKPEKIYDCVYEVKERVRIITNLEKDEEINKIINNKNSNNFVKTATGEYVEIIKAIDEDEIRSYLDDIIKKGIKSIAVSFVHSYAYREHESIVKKIAQEYGYFENISVSSEIMPMVKFYPRSSTSVVDAYLTPAIYKYTQRFLSYFDNPNISVLFMQSDGGLTSHKTFFGSKAIISGPAGGVVGYSITTSKEIKNMPIIGLDMGGTSTDVSRYDNGWEHVFEVQIAGVAINSPQIDVNTVAAGGGSRLFYKNEMFVVGPESAGAEPGPVCYKKNGYLAVTDANLILGRLVPKYFPHIFGKNADEPLSYEYAYEEFLKLTNKINTESNLDMTVEEAALGFIKVANEAMCRPIRSLTQARGHDPKDHILSIFGGAGGQHACSLARNLKMSKVYIHKYAGILSAYGLSMAEIVEEKQEPLNKNINEKGVYQDCKILFAKLEESLKEKLKPLTNKDLKFKLNKYLLIRYEGNDYNLIVQENPYDPGLDSYKKDFEKEFLREYGFLLEKREILIDYVRLRVSLVPVTSDDEEIMKNSNIKSYRDYSDCNKPEEYTSSYFEIDSKVTNVNTPLYIWEKLYLKSKINGPSLILSGNSTIVIEPNCIAYVTPIGNLLIELLNLNEDLHQNKSNKENSITTKDPLELALFANRFMSIAEQMGRHLQRTSVSTNIKERLDFSCAIFDFQGNLVANAPHLPVHLGAMQEVVKHQIQYLGDNWKKGEVILCNHPMAGGSHLPDLTVITPVYHNDKVIFFVGNRGHHSDIGGLTPGSMPPFSKNLDEEGAAIYSFKLIENGFFKEKELIEIFTTELIKKGVNPTRNLKDNISDLKAQIAANNKGIDLITEMIEKYGLYRVQIYMKYLQETAEHSVRDMLDKFGESINIEKDTTGTVYAQDFMDDGSKICLSVTIDRKDKKAIFDFTGTSPQVYGNINTPRAVTYSAIIYCLRCLINSDIPLNQGCLTPVEIIIPKNSLLWPSATSAVVGGNVTTSQRITDITLKAFNACAASQGDMNNFTFGNESSGYYETIGGGSGAGPTWHGKSGVQVHMTNTRITDVEIIERRYTVMILNFSLRKNSGGKGNHHGGDGIIRSFKFLTKMNASILSERRVFAPFGLNGGEDGKKGENILIKYDGTVYNIGSKNSISVDKGDILIIKTPGGGGFGKANEKEENSKGEFSLDSEIQKIYHAFGSISRFLTDQYTN